MGPDPNAQYNSGGQPDPEITVMAAVHRALDPSVPNSPAIQAIVDAAEQGRAAAIAELQRRNGAGSRAAFVGRLFGA
jgi:hypothetical protein